MANFRNGQTVLVPPMVKGGTTRARFIRMERRVVGRRWVNFAIVRYNGGRAEMPLAPSLVLPA